MQQNILVVDDEAIARRFMERALTEAGYGVMLANDGEQALDLIRTTQRTIALVVTDLVMPGMGGRECFRALKALDPGVRAVLCSGYGFNIAAQELLDEGMLEFLPKPYALPDLGATVARVLNPSRPPRPRATPRSRSG